MPRKKGKRYYFSRNTGLENQSVLYSQPSISHSTDDDKENQEHKEEEEPVLLIDPNTLSEDGTVALMGWTFSEDGNLMAYSLSSGGSDWRTVKLMQVDQDTGLTTDRPVDVLEKVKFSGITWTHDNLGFFYNRYKTSEDAKGAGTEVHLNVDQRVAYHRVGTSQEEDIDVLATPDHPDWLFGTEVSHDGRWLIVTVSSGCEPTNQLWLVDLNDIPRHGEHGVAPLDFSAYDINNNNKKKKQVLPVKKVVDNFNAQWEYVGNKGNSWTFQTNLDAPRYRVVRCNNITSFVASSEQQQSSLEWEDVIPEHGGGSDLLQWCVLVKGDVLVTCWLSNIQSKLELRDYTTGAVKKEIDLPGIGSVSGFSGSYKDSQFFFGFTGFTEPGAHYLVDVSRPDPTPLLKRRIATKGFDPEDYVTKQEWATSKDGTKIPMFVVHRKGLELNGTNPTILYGYGGFNISLEPSFSVSRLCWLLAYDGVYAIANLRGGGEFGREWRDAGSLGNKQNVFDDFQACAEHLHSSNYCSPSTTAILGGSNGGLLVAACANQRPDLYACVLAQVGVMDMLRFKYFTIGHAWCSDYGDVEKEEHFKWIMEYSPLHNVSVPVGGGGGQYPAYLILTGDHDDRVVPLHSHKLTATLQHVLVTGTGVRTTQRNPLLTRIETRAGHGSGKPVGKIIEETADMYAYAATVMGAGWKHT